MHYKQIFGKIIGLLLLTLIISCKAKWDKEKVYKECMKKAKLHYDMNIVGNKKGSETICNCIADKMIGQFKTEGEANKKLIEQFYIGDDCKREYANTLK